MRNVMLIRDLVPTIDRDIYNLCEFVLGLLRSGIIVQHPPLSQPKEFDARYPSHHIMFDCCRKWFIHSARHRDDVLHV
jgi:hypothetical protein